MDNNIKKLRTAADISQNDLAKLCNVTRQTINAIENNKYDPTLSLAFSIAHALKTGIDKVFNYNAKKN
ncbi:helix-turn-helix transcriptional regulator [Bacillus velezensis]|uniref:helix-turn-helix transcriptional regulator n=1 Tax=Bacillus velezensis TaxID=492670 RepID=UPI002E233C54|nr:helix-turn-helix transcriptional regulator [Bacillus velezensis]